MTLTERQASFAADLAFSDLPEDVVDYAKRLLLDTAGIAVGAEPRAASSDSFFEGVRALDSGSGGTVLATGESMGPEYAALLNGAMAHSLDYDDTHRGSSLHPGAPVLPAALAAAERVDASGADLLAGVVAGYEVTIRLGMAVDPESHYGRGFHMTATCGTFGATAAAGSVLGLDADVIESAMGINGSQAAGSLQFLENGGWNKRAHPGFAAHRALVALSLAEAGFAAANEPLEGPRGFLRGYSDDPHPDLAVAGLGEEWETTRTGIKPYPCCRYMHNALDQLLEIAESEDVSPGEIESVDVLMPEAGVSLTGDPANTYPQSLVDGQFSMPFGAGLALTRGSATVDDFIEEIEGGVSDDVRRVIDRTTVGSGGWVAEAFPGKWAVEVTVETADGTYTRESDFARGEPENPMTWEEVVEKYESLTEPVLGESSARHFRERIADLERVSVAELLEPVTGERAVTADD
ncbi:MmgE/PrpD family protein [Salinirubellus sp. GCM10025818]|uniref:MmgE/PrpD family protein n=1 Tax=Salinirubellus TaxID=2162630 RepID=UPI0030CF0A32